MAKTRIIRIKYLLRSIGIPPHILGYLYAAEAIDYMASMPKKTLLINEAYRHVAAVYLTSDICVEASIRNAVRKAVAHKTPLFNETFGNTKSVGNHMFLTTLRDVFEENNSEYIAKHLKQ